MRQRGDKFRLGTALEAKTIRTARFEDLGKSMITRFEDLEKNMTARFEDLKQEVRAQRK